MASSDDIYISEIAVASVDILGVKNLIDRSDRSLSAIDVVTRFVANATSSGIYRERSLDSKIRDLFAIDLYLGDSVYLFADARRPIRDQIEDLILKVAPLIDTGLRGESPFLVRAGIAVGDLRTRMVRNDRFQREIRLGTSMLRAHRLETSQAWIGGAIAESILEDGFGRWTTPYPVPIKQAVSGVSAKLALNWVGEGWAIAALEAKLREAATRIGLGEEERAKLENTLAFVRHVFETGKFGPMKVLSNREDPLKVSGDIVNTRPSGTKPR